METKFCWCKTLKVKLILCIKNLIIINIISPKIISLKFRHVLLIARIMYCSSFIYSQLCAIYVLPSESCVSKFETFLSIIRFYHWINTDSRNEKYNSVRDKSLPITSYSKNIIIFESYEIHNQTLLY